ncbi:VanZ family protein [Undibacterium sp.]|uniref:VanZ family protein n=1 Tax=Undibacterium sp. TaxID=1914977 RepID=UPI00374DD732
MAVFARPANMRFASLHLSSLLLDERYRRTRLRSAFIFYALILVLGSVPGARQKIGELASGGVLHAMAYGGITLLLFTGFAGTGLRNACMAVATVVWMGALDETVQSFFPYRSATVSDWLVDIAASAITAVVLWRWWPQRGLPSIRR